MAAAFVFVNESSAYAAKALDIIRRYFLILELNPKSPGNAGDAITISVLNHVRVESEFLKLNNVNIHAAPPWYPGWGGIPRAMHDGMRIHGTCAHRMTERLDEGSIFFTHVFDISPEMAYREILKRTMESVLVSLEQACLRMKHGGIDRTVRWSGDAMGWNELISWLKTQDQDWRDDAIADYSRRKE